MSGPDTYTSSSTTKLHPRPKAAPYFLLLILCAALLGAGTIVYSTWLTHETSQILLPLGISSGQIQTHTATAYLWTEEYVLKNRHIGADEIRDQLRQAEDAFSAMVGREKRLTHVFMPESHREWHRQLPVMEQQLAELRAITEQLLASPRIGGAGSAIDEEQEKAFLRLQTVAAALDEDIRLTVHVYRKRYYVIQTALALSCFIAWIAAGVLVFRFRRSQRAYLDALAASNQQLTASNQQLRAVEQQLRASNQQLMATDQQLRASNQQLHASELALRESERRFRSLFTAMSEGVALHRIIYDPAGKPVDYAIVEVNKQYEEIIGRPRDSVVNRSATEIYGVPEAPYLAEYSRVAETGEVVRFETYFPPMDRWFAISVFSPQQGKFATVFSDITDRKKANAALRQNALRFETLLDISHHRVMDTAELLDYALEKALVLLNCRFGYIFYYDEQAQTFTHASWSKEVMKQCSMTQKGTTFGLAQSGLRGEAVRQRKPVIVNDFSAVPLAHGCPEGHVELKRFLSIPIFRDDTVVAVAAVANRDTDFTDDDVRELTLLADSVWKLVDLRRETGERHRLEARMQKLESVGVLAGGIAHDFNNLLTAILANVTFARIRAKSGEPVESSLREIQAASERARDLTQQLLTFAKGGKPVKKLSRLEPLIRESCAFAASGTNALCRFRIAGDLNAAEVDAGQIGQVLHNLVLNAVQAMPGGGTVTIEAENASVASGARLPLAPGPYVRISVRDEGVGIPPQHKDRIFDPYFTTKQKGSGLGLAVSHSVVAGHRGHIIVDSHLGKGSAFHVFLPASQERVQEEAGHALLQGRGGGSVLIMDDEEMLRRVSTTILESLAYSVETAQDGREAVEHYERRLKAGKPFDAVILDLTVPGGMGGVEAVARILALDPGAKVFVSSGYSNDPVMSDYARYGFCGVLPKPYSADTLAQALNEVLGKYRERTGLDG